MEFWDALDFLERIYLVFAVPATLMLIIQAVLAAMGADNDSVDADVDIDGGPDFSDYEFNFQNESSGLALFTVRGVSAFFAVGGFAGLTVYRSGFHYILSFLVAFLAGAAALTGIAFVFRAFGKLQANGNISALNAVGKVAQVYIPVPASGAGTGKVTLTCQDRFVEMDARTNGNIGIHTGETVNIVGVLGDNTLIVEPAGIEKMLKYEYKPDKEQNKEQNKEFANIAK